MSCFYPTQQNYQWGKNGTSYNFQYHYFMLFFPIYTWTVNRLLVTQSQIWNVKHRKTKWIWVSNVDIGCFNQSEAQISLCSRSALHSKTNIKCSPSLTKRKALEMRVIKSQNPTIIRHLRVILDSLALPWE